MKDASCGGVTDLIQLPEVPADDGIDRESDQDLGRPDPR